MKKIGIVLAGGGSKGAFEVGALSVLVPWIRKKFGSNIQLVLRGVSVGALNVVGMAEHGLPWLIDFWSKVKQDDVYKSYPKWIQPFRLLVRGKRGWYSNDPLQRLVHRKITREGVRKSGYDVRVGAVNLETTELVMFGPQHPKFVDAVVASTAIPLIWQPIVIDGDDYVDGGVIDVTPIGSAIDAGVDFMIIVTTSPADYVSVQDKGGKRSILEVGKRSLDLHMEEAFKADVREFERINEILSHFGGRHPKYRHIPHIIIQPPVTLGDGLDFSRHKLDWRFELGVSTAEKILGL